MKKKKKYILKIEKEKQMNYPCPYLVMPFLFIFIEIPTFFPSSQTRIDKSASLIFLEMLFFHLPSMSYLSSSIYIYMFSNLTCVCILQI
jgi:hypothetical protein